MLVLDAGRAEERVFGYLEQRRSGSWYGLCIKAVSKDVGRGRICDFAILERILSAGVTGGNAVETYLVKVVHRLAFLAFPPLDGGIAYLR